MPSTAKDHKKDTQTVAARDLANRIGTAHENAAEIRQAATQDAARAKYQHDARVADLQRRHDQMKNEVTQQMEARAVQPADRVSISRQAEELQTHQEEHLQNQITIQTKVLGQIAREADMLQERQQAERQLITAQGNAVEADTAARLSTHLQAQQTRLLELAQEINETIAKYAQDSDRQAKIARDEFRKAIAQNEKPGDLEALRKNQEADATRLETDFRRRIDFLNNQIRENRLLLPDDNAAELQSRMVAAMNEQHRDHALEQSQAGEMLQRLSAESIQAVAREALKSMFHLFQVESANHDQIRQQMISRMTGQLFEELANEAIASSAQRWAQDAERAEYIAGDTIRNEAGRKLTDGILAWQDAEQRSRRVAFEAKAGPFAAEKLERELTKLTVDDREELEQYARDLAEEEVLRRNEETDDEYRSRRAQALHDATADQRTYIELLTEVHIDDLLDREVQEESGQLQRTNERLSQAQRLYVEGRAREDLGVTDGRSTEVVRVLPKNVALEQDAFRLDITAEELRRAAQVALEYLEDREEELRRRRQEENVEE